MSVVFENVIPMNEECAAPEPGKIITLGGQRGQLVDLHGDPARRDSAAEAMQRIASQINRQCGVSDTGEPLTVEEQEQEAAKGYQVTPHPDGEIFHVAPHPAKPELSVLIDVFNRVVAVVTDRGVANLIADSVRSVFQAHALMQTQGNEGVIPDEAA